MRCWAISTAFSMQLIHYSPEKLEACYPCCYLQSERSHKPNGLWVSCEQENTEDIQRITWREYCIWEGYKEWLAHAHEVTLTEDANILCLDTSQKMWDFTKAHAYTGRHLEFTTYFEDNHYVNWLPITQTYQGIIIAPYFWKFRLHPAFSWYYTWDCASGCIWDLNAIAAFKEIDHV